MPDVLARDDAPEQLPTTAKSVAKKVGMLRWTERRLRTVVHIEDTFFVSGDRAGELKKAAHEEQHTWLFGAHPKLQIGFTAHWKNTSFDYARIVERVDHAAIGQPTELWFDYSPASTELRQKKDEPEWAYERRIREVKQHAERQDGEYNDGVSYLAKDYIINGKKDFDAWLDGWVEMLTKGAAA